MASILSFQMHFVFVLSYLCLEFHTTKSKTVSTNNRECSATRDLWTKQTGANSGEQNMYTHAYKVQLCIELDSLFMYGDFISKNITNLLRIRIFRALHKYKNIICQMSNKKLSINLQHFGTITIHIFIVFMQTFCLPILKF